MIIVIMKGYLRGEFECGKFLFCPPNTKNRTYASRILTDGFLVVELDNPTTAQT